MSWQYHHQQQEQEQEQETGAWCTARGLFYDEAPDKKYFRSPVFVASLRSVTSSATEIRSCNAKVNGVAKIRIRRKRRLSFHAESVRSLGNGPNE